MKTARGGHTAPQSSRSQLCTRCVQPQVRLTRAGETRDDAINEEAAGEQAAAAGAAAAELPSARARKVLARCALACIPLPLPLPVAPVKPAIANCANPLSRADSSCCSC